MFLMFNFLFLQKVSKNKRIETTLKETKRRPTYRYTGWASPFDISISPILSFVCVHIILYYLDCTEWNGLDILHYRDSFSDALLIHCGCLFFPFHHCFSLMISLCSFPTESIYLYKSTYLFADQVQPDQQERDPLEQQEVEMDSLCRQKAPCRGS